MRPSLRTVWVAALFTLALTGCRESKCGPRGENANVSGQWTLTATAERKGCGPSGSDERVQLKSGLALEMRQVARGGGLDTLEWVDPARDAGTFVLTGTVEGSCVDFATVEETPSGRLRWSFEGQVRGSSIDGEAREVNSACPASGTFVVDILPTSGSTSRAGQVIENPDGSVRSYWVDAGCRFPDGGEDAGTPDGGEVDAGEVDADAGEGFDAGEPVDDGGFGCFRRPESVTEHVYFCSVDVDCAQGVCSRGVCVVGCERSTDCNVGDSCIQQRCASAPGCGCGQTGLALSSVLLAAVGIAGRRRRHR